MQILKYKWKDMKPQLITNQDTLDLMGNEISMKLGERFCTGYRKGGSRKECPERRKVDAWMCNECQIRDDFFMCVKCTGEKCINKKQRPSCRENSYFIYLAAFDDLLKVGISYEYRFLQRFIEQGADLAAKIARVKDGKTVRSMEQEIRSELGITDRVHGTTKVKNLFGDPNKSVQKIMSAITTLRGNWFSDDLMEPEIYDLRRHYKLHNVLSEPEELEILDGTTVEGKVAAAKGNVIVLEKDHKFFAVNSHRLIGREILEMNGQAAGKQARLDDLGP